MKKIRRILFVLLIPCISYAAVYLMPERTNQEIGWNEETAGTGGMGALVKAVSGSGLEEESETGTTEEIKRPESQEDKKNELSREPDLSEKDEAFLEKHLYGQWVFTERLVELEERRRIEIWDANFSAQGVEEMKNIVISYEKTKVYGYDNGQDTFQNAVDMYLYLAYGGANPVSYPEYHVDYDVDENEIHLRDLVNIRTNKIKFPEKENIVEVYYNMKNRQLSADSYSMGRFLGEMVYIDPSDTESIYMDFCGLWKLERYKK